jgi:hypothetical protein
MTLLDGLDLPDPAAMLLAKMVQYQGNDDANTRANLREMLRTRWHIDDEAEQDRALEAVRTLVYRTDACLYLCQGRSCQRQTRFKNGQTDLLRDASRIGIPLISTRCHGPCRQAPIATIRVGKTWELFSQFHERSDWERILEFARHAVSSETLPIQGREAVNFDRHA